MTARCPECRTRYRIAREKIGPRGARLRCTRCDTTFRVHTPGGETNDDSLLTEREVAAPRAAAPANAPQPTAGGASAARALVADTDAERAKRIAAFLARWSITADVVHDGREALVRIFRGAPQLAVLGPKLAKLDAPALCEVVRRSAQLAALRLIRVSSSGEAGPDAAQEAHVVLDVGDLPDGLAGALQRFGLGTKPALTAAAPAAAPPQPVAQKPAAPKPVAPKPAARPAPATPAAAAQSSDDPAVAAALRLARIVVSDIVLYNPDKFAAAAAAGTAGRALAAELEEARAMFNQRVPENVRAGRDFLVEELERRARATRG